MKSPRLRDLLAAGAAVLSVTATLVTAWTLVGGVDARYLLPLSA